MPHRASALIIDAEAPVRLDKWLWAARLFKTRALAAEAVDRGRVRLNATPVKPARELKPGDELEVRIGDEVRTLRVLALSRQRGPAAVAQALYAETAESLAAREQLREQRALAPEPAAAREDGRPTKRERRELATWQRWSASADD